MMPQPCRCAQSLVRTPKRRVTGDSPTTTLVGLMPLIVQGRSSAAAEPAVATTVEAARPSAAVAAARRRLGTEVLRWGGGGRAARFATHHKAIGLPGRDSPKASTQRK